jgi:hypothetical protein
VAPLSGEHAAGRLRSGGGGAEHHAERAAAVDRLVEQRLRRAAVVPPCRRRRDSRARRDGEAVMTVAAGRGGPIATGRTGAALERSRSRRSHNRRRPNRSRSHRRRCAGAVRRIEIAVLGGHLGVGAFERGAGLGGAEKRSTSSNVSSRSPSSVALRIRAGWVREGHALIDRRAVRVVAVGAVHDDAPTVPPVEPFAVCAAGPGLDLPARGTARTAGRADRAWPHLARREREFIHACRHMARRARRADLGRMNRLDVAVCVLEAFVARDTRPAGDVAGCARVRLERRAAERGLERERAEAPRVAGSRAYACAAPLEGRAARPEALVHRLGHYAWRAIPGSSGSGTAMAAQASRRRHRDAVPVGPHPTA